MNDDEYDECNMENVLFPIINDEWNTIVTSTKIGKKEEGGAMLLEDWKTYFSSSTSMIVKIEQEEQDVLIYPALIQQQTNHSLNNNNNNNVETNYCPTTTSSSSCNSARSSTNKIKARQLSPIDSESVQNLISPCLNYNNTNNNNNRNYISEDCVYHREKTELSDVLFSFKATPQMALAVHPNQMSPASYSANSYTQPQQLFTPNGYSANYCSIDPPFGQQSASHTNASSFSPSFPAMSVNVSMHMTMGYLPPPPPPLSEGSGLQHHHHHHHHQLQWSSNQVATSNQISPPTSYPSYSTTGGSTSQSQNICSQTYNTNYNFAADFRAEQPLEAIRSHWIPSSSTSSIPLLTTASNSGGVAIDGIKSFQHHHHHHSSSSNHSSNNNSKHHSHKTSRSLENVSPSGHSDGTPTKTNLCRICGKTYARPSTLKTHLRTHSGEKPYRCLECYKSFSQAANLTAHVRTHSGEKPFHCSICDRKFSQSSSVTTHMRTHSGEKPYRCRLCKKAFSDSSTLTKHLRIHSGEKPYQCRCCLLRFSQSGNLNRHMRVHSSLSNNNNNNNNNNSHC